MDKNDIIKIIDGIPYYNNDYIGFLYNELADRDKILNKINKMFEADTYCENIYYAIGVLLNKKYFFIDHVDNEELLKILNE